MGELPNKSIRADDASCLHMTCLERLKQPKLETAIDKVLKDVRASEHRLYVTRHFCVSVSAASTPTLTVQVHLVAINAKQVMCAYSPQTEIRIATVIDGQATMNANDTGSSSRCLAGSILFSWVT